MSRRPGPTFVLASLLVAGGCSGGGAATPDATGAAGSMGGAGTTGGAGKGPDAAVDPNAVVGAFRLGIHENPMPPPTVFASVDSSVVYDAPNPMVPVLKDKATDGDCTLRVPSSPFCSTACGNQVVCVADETCQPYATAQDVGTVTVKGAKLSTGETEAQLMRVAGFYQLVGVTLAYPAWDEGGDLSVEATGGAYAPFTIHAKGIATLTVPADPIPFERDKPMALTWSPKGPAGDSMMHLRIDISHHGGLRGVVECDVPDTGSYTISAALVTQLINLGVSGFPVVLFTRSSVGETSIAPGKVQLIVGEDVERQLKIPGLTSCNTEIPCPTGQTCQKDLQCK
jgi:hypothetical protein